MENNSPGFTRETISSEPTNNNGLNDNGLNRKSRRRMAALFLSESKTGRPLRGKSGNINKWPSERIKQRNTDMPTSMKKAIGLHRSTVGSSTAIFMRNRGERQVDYSNRLYTELPVSTTVKLDSDGNVYDINQSKLMLHDAGQYTAAYFRDEHGHLQFWVVDSRDVKVKVSRKEEGGKKGNRLMVVAPKGHSWKHAGSAAALTPEFIAAYPSAAEAVENTLLYMANKMTRISGEADIMADPVMGDFKALVDNTPEHAGKYAREVGKDFFAVNLDPIWGKNNEQRVIPRNSFAAAELRKIMDKINPDLMALSFYEDPVAGRGFGMPIFTELPEEELMLSADFDEVTRNMIPGMRELINALTQHEKDAYGARMHEARKLVAAARQTNQNGIVAISAMPDARLYSVVSRYYNVMIPEHMKTLRTNTSSGQEAVRRLTSEKSILKYFNHLALTAQDIAAEKPSETELGTINDPHQKQKRSIILRDYVRDINNALGKTDITDETQPAGWCAVYFSDSSLPRYLFPGNEFPDALRKKYADRGIVVDSHRSLNSIGLMAMSNTPIYYLDPRDMEDFNLTTPSSATATIGKVGIAAHKYMESPVDHQEYIKKYGFSGKRMDVYNELKKEEEAKKGNVTLALEQALKRPDIYNDIKEYQKFNREFASLMAHMTTRINAPGMSRALHAMGEFRVRTESGEESFIFSPDGALFLVKKDVEGAKRKIIPVPAGIFGKDSVYNKVLKALAEKAKSDMDAGYTPVGTAYDVVLAAHRFDMETGRAFVNWHDKLIEQVDRGCFDAFREQLQAANFLADISYNSMSNYSPHGFVTTKERADEAAAQLQKYVDNVYKQKMLKNGKFFLEYNVTTEMAKQAEMDIAAEMTRLQSNLEILSSQIMQGTHEIAALALQGPDGLPVKSILTGNPRNPGFIERMSDMLVNTISSAYRKFSGIMGASWKSLTDFDQVLGDAYEAAEFAFTRATKLFFRLFWDKFVDTHFAGEKLSWFRKLSSWVLSTLFGVKEMTSIDRETIEKLSGGETVGTSSHQLKTTFLTARLEPNAVVHSTLAINNAEKRLAAQAFIRDRDITPTMDERGSERTHPGFVLTYRVKDPYAARELGYNIEDMTDKNNLIDWWRQKGFAFLFPSNMYDKRTNADLFAVNNFKTDDIRRKALNTRVEQEANGSIIKVFMSLTDFRISADDMYPPDKWRAERKDAARAAQYSERTYQEPNWTRATPLTDEEETGLEQRLAREYD